MLTMNCPPVVCASTLNAYTMPHPQPRKPKLLDQVREALRVRHYSRRTEKTYCDWVKRFIYFHNLRHPAEMAEPEINAFLSHLAIRDKVSASTQNQALCALLFLYRHVLGREVSDLGDVIRARKTKNLPVVMTRDEVKVVLDRLRDDKCSLSACCTAQAFVSWNAFGFGSRMLTSHLMRSLCGRVKEEKTGEPYCPVR